MKKIYFLSLLLFSVSLANATIWTVDNDTLSPGYPGQFPSVQSAHDAALAGDTLLIYGSAISYGSVIINKRLTLIGPGFNPQGQNHNPVIINDITLDSLIPTSSAIGSRFIGLTVFQIKKKTLDFFQIDNIIFERCRIGETTEISYVSGSNWIFRNCLFTWSAGGNLSIEMYNDILILNNLFCFGPIQHPNSPAIVNSNKSTVFINNNIFTGYHQGSSFSTVSNAQINNNIFFGKSPQGVSSSVFEKNLTYASSQTQIPYGSNTGNMNFVAVDPQFVSVPINTFSCGFSYDFHLQATSPGLNAGTDNTDIGIFGGSFPMPTYNNIITGMPAIPFIAKLQINGSNSILINSPLNVYVKGVNNN